MESEDEIKLLLTEIRDLQREHLTEFKKALAASIKLRRRWLLFMAGFFLIFFPLYLVFLIFSAAGGSGGV